jgi:hypothetical protein
MEGMLFDTEEIIPVYIGFWGGDLNPPKDADKKGVFSQLSGQQRLLSLSAALSKASLGARSAHLEVYPHIKHPCVKVIGWRKIV